MKVQELRELLKLADRVLLEKAFVESYKQFSKRQKENIDLIISDILSGKDVKKLKQESVIDFDKLEQEIHIFLENAYAQNYFSPNRTIPKNQRSKWRFLVKNYIKELQKIPAGNENHANAVSLMAKLYAMLCEACCYYLFSTEDPFRSIGWEQPDLFELLVRMTFQEDLTQENISMLVQLASARGLSQESMHIQQQAVLISELPTDDARRTAREAAEKLIADQKAMLAKSDKGSSSRYNIEETINELCNMILILSNIIGEPESGIAYYFKNCQESMGAAKLYHALDTAEFMGDDPLWIRVYEYAVKHRIKPYAFSQEQYQKKKELCSD